MASLMLMAKEKKTTRKPSSFLPRVFPGDHNFRCVLINRQDIERRLTDSSASSLDERLKSYRRYIDSLFTLLPIFTVSLERSGLMSFAFTWYDAFKRSKNLLNFWKSNKETQTSIRYEMAVVLFNFGAIYSQIAVEANRSSTIQKACRAFQSSAGAFMLLKDRVLHRNNTWKSVDLLQDCANVLEMVMLAQAEECFAVLAVRMALEMRLSPESCSKVSRKVSLRYKDAYDALSSHRRIKKRLGKAWVSHLQLKTAHFDAEACHLYSMELHREEEIGEEIARLRLGISILSNAKRTAMGSVDASLIVAASELEKRMSSDLDRAKKQNDSTYHMPIPKESSLIDLPAGDSQAVATTMEIPDFFTNAME